MIEAAPAKINLHLHVTGKRPDGYHLLDSLVVFAGAADIVTAQPADDLTLELTGPFAEPLRAFRLEDNLVLRAAHALADAHGVRAGARIVLDKRLPLASGIGGGSADAAATIRVLRRLWQLDVPLRAELAVSLGADVPVCLAGEPAIMRGIGEELHSAPALPSLELLLVNPLLPVATADIFRRRAGRPFSAPAALPARWSSATAAAETLAGLANDLQQPAIDSEPTIGRVLSEIARQDGCLLARMSGSGATCFGIFEPGTGASRARDALARSDWWLWAGPLMPAQGTHQPN